MTTFNLIEIDKINLTTYEIRSRNEISNSENDTNSLVNINLTK